MDLTSPAYVLGQPTLEQYKPGPGERLNRLLDQVHLRLSGRQEQDLKEAIYTLQETSEWEIDYACAARCWQLVEAALAGHLGSHIDEFRM